MPAGFVGNFIPVLLNSALTASPICKPFSGGISVQNIPQGPRYFARFAGYITLGLAMIPKRTEWKSWSALEKVTYVAQLAAALALLPTVVFAYLGWREARLARDDQTQFFLAEKAPHLEVSEISVATGLLTIEFNNTGESLAKDIQMKLLVIDSKTGSVKPIPLLDIIEKAPLSVAKNHKFALPVQSNIELEKTLGFIPSEIRLYDIKTLDNSGQFHPVLNVIAEYTDVRQRPYVAVATAKLVK